jgi:hypothetical protein
LRFFVWTGKGPVIAAILANGGADPKNSGFIYHFNTYDQLMLCRDTLQVVAPQAFHMSPLAIATANAYLPPGQAIAPQQAIARAWIVQKTQVLSTDYSEDKAFFKI